MACRECGADDETGWSGESNYDDLNLPPRLGPEIPDTLEGLERAFLAPPVDPTRPELESAPARLGPWGWALVIAISMALLNTLWVLLSR